MANFSSEENISRVDTGAMREAAASIEGNLKSIEAVLSELAGITRILNGASGNGGGAWAGVSSQLLGSAGAGDGRWQGPAAEAYVAMLTKLLAAASSAKDLYAAIPSELRQHAEDYETAHGIALAAANGIKAVTWAEPLP